MSEQSLNRKLSWYSSIKSFIDSMFTYNVDEPIKTDIDLEIIVPTNIVYRTQMICDFISKQLGTEFCLYDFIMLLYIDFIDNSIKKYEPLKMLKTLNINNNQSISIYCMDESYEYDKHSENRKLVIITITKEDSERGQILLDEMEELYGQKISLEKMFNSIWINFIEDYKHGKNKDALSYIIKIIKDESK